MLSCNIEGWFFMSDWFIRIRKVRLNLEEEKIFRRKSSNHEKEMNVSVVFENNFFLKTFSAKNFIKFFHGTPLQERPGTGCPGNTGRMGQKKIGKQIRKNFKIFFIA